MCGICGIFNLDLSPIDKNILNQMTKIVAHRGPDDEGYLLVDTQIKNTYHCHHNDTIQSIQAKTHNLFNNFSANLGFGFRRLSILDLSEKGHQPMCNDDGQLWIVFNGEVYNYIELRSELQHLGYHFNTNTDTEVILKSYEQWGENCLNMFNGMWAFAIWDNKNQKLFCARDRFGIKPFYYYFDGKQFIFASEIKQLLLNDIDKSINERNIYRSIKLNSFLIYGPDTYFTKIQILPHSHYLLLENGNFYISRYYDLNPEMFERCSLSFAEAVEQYRFLLTDSVKLRMRSDVEVGSSLSGGLDSSALVRIATNISKTKFKTFSSYYTNSDRFDERIWVNILANTTNIITHFISPSPEDALQNLKRQTFIHDYPILGSSLISQYFVMQLAHANNVTVLINGQGSDEMSAGYNHAFYRYYADLMRNIDIKSLFNELPSYLRHNRKGSVLNKLAKTLLAYLFNESTLYRNELRYTYINPFSNPYNDNDFVKFIIDQNTSKLSNFLYNLMMSTSIQTLLHFEDRNSMAFSIESRVPFLDYRLVEFTFSLPSKFKIHKHHSKYIHREALRGIVPEEILNRKDKVNFATPGESVWLGNEIRNYVNELFISPDFINRDIYNHKRIQNSFKKYLNGDTRQGRLIWKIVALENWFQVFVDSKLPNYTDL